MAGLVPAPKQNNPNLFLRSDGEWTEVIATSESLVLQTIVGDNESHAAAINRIVNNFKINKGDIAILKELIANELYQHISYVYNGENWVAMDGNYNAENVYFNDDILVTTKIGTIQTLVNGQATLPAKGKNVKQVLSSLLAERKNPTATKPSASIELTNDILTYEVGEIVTPTWKTTFSSGSYTYGPATGVTDTGGVVSSTKDENVLTIAAGKINNMTGFFDDYQVEDNVKYYAKLKYGWNEGTVNPVDNFGDEYVNIVNNLPIQAASGKTDDSNNYISGYRKWFKGGLNTDSVTTPLTSTVIRNNLTGSSSAVTSHTFDLRAADFDGCKRIIIAIPSTENKVVTQVYLKSASNADITSLFEELENTIDVAGANDYIAKPYRVWVYEPASLDPTEIYTITLG